MNIKLSDWIGIVGILMSVAFYIFAPIELFKRITFAELMIIITLLGVIIIQKFQEYKSTQEHKKVLGNRNALIEANKKLTKQKDRYVEINTILNTMFVISIPEYCENKLKKIYEAYLELLKKLD